MKRTITPDSISPDSIAPCGMNCRLCIAFLRDRKACPGCVGDSPGKPDHCAVCRIRNCVERENEGQRFCGACPGYPCSRLRMLDKRYRTKYGMSMLENLGAIREKGLDPFVRQERKRWKCPSCSAIICVHRDHCIYCGRKRDDASAERP